MLHASPPFRRPIESSVVKEKKEESMLSSNTLKESGGIGERGGKEKVASVLLGVVFLVYSYQISDTSIHRR